MKIKEIRSLNKKDIEEKLKELKKALIKLNSSIATGTNPKNPAQIKNIKKTIARIHTAVRENEGP